MSQEYRDKLKSINVGLQRRREVPKLHTHEDEHGTTYAREHYDDHVGRVDVDIHPNTVEVDMGGHPAAGVLAGQGCDVRPAAVEATSGGMI